MAADKQSSSAQHGRTLDTRKPLLTVGSNIQPILFERPAFSVIGMEALFREGEDGNAGSLHTSSCRGITRFSSYMQSR